MEELRDFDGGYEEDNEDFKCALLEKSNRSLKSNDKYEAENIIQRTRFSS